MAKDAILEQPGGGFIVGLLTNRLWRVSSKRPRLPVLGQCYTREEIREMVGGGGATSYLPSAKGRIVACCFMPQVSPEGPERVCVSPGPVLVAQARQAVRESVVIPVFIWRKEHQWEYMGRYQAVKFDRSLEERERAASVVNQAAAKRRQIGLAGAPLAWKDQGERILALAAQGLMYKEIAALVGVPKTSVFRYVKNAKALELAEGTPNDSQDPEQEAGDDEIGAGNATPAEIAGVLLFRPSRK